jgi:hypothetical protein
VKALPRRLGFGCVFVAVPTGANPTQHMAGPSGTRRLDPEAFALLEGMLQLGTTVASRCLLPAVYVGGGARGAGAQRQGGHKTRQPVVPPVRVPTADPSKRITAASALKVRWWPLACLSWRSSSPPPPPPTCGARASCSPNQPSKLPVPPASLHSLPTRLCVNGCTGATRSSADSRRTFEACPPVRCVGADSPTVAACLHRPHPPPRATHAHARTHTHTHAHTHTHRHTYMHTHHQRRRRRRRRCNRHHRLHQHNTPSSADFTARTREYHFPYRAPAAQCLTALRTFGCVVVCSLARCVSPVG